MVKGFCMIICVTGKKWNELFINQFSFIPPGNMKEIGKQRTSVYLGKHNTVKKKYRVLTNIINQ